LGGDVEAPEPGQAPAENRRGEQARRDEEAEPDAEDDDPDGESDEPEEPGDDTGEHAADGDQEPDHPASPEEDPSAPDEQRRVPFPCPLEGAVAGTDEQTPVTLPNDPWYLEASSLTLYGLDYHGVVNVTTADGTVKQALKFTAERIDIGDLHQIVD